MKPAASPTAGFKMMMVLMAVLITCAGWLAWHRTVVIDDAGIHVPHESGLRWPDMRLDINACTAAELSLLPGIGSQRAETIVANRDANGPFITVSDITRVKGIGPITLQQIEPFVVCEPVPIPSDPMSVRPND